MVDGGAANSRRSFCRQLGKQAGLTAEKIAVTGAEVYRAGGYGGFMKTVAIYPGSFDPITNGHLDVLRRATSMFDHVIVGIAPNAEKHPLFTTPERLALTRAAIKGIRRKVPYFSV